MTKSTGTRRDRSKLLAIGKELRPLHPDRPGLTLRRRTRPNGKELLYVAFSKSSDPLIRGEKFLLLSCDVNASDVAITTAVADALRGHDQGEAGRKSPQKSSMSSTLEGYRRAAIKSIAQATNTDKHKARRRRWVELLVEHLQETGGKANRREDLEAWIRHHPASKRARRDAISAACHLFKTATGQYLSPDRELNYKQPDKGQGEPIDDEEIKGCIAHLWDLAEGNPDAFTEHREPNELAHCAAWLISWVALTGARGAMVMASQLMHKQSGEVSVKIGAFINCRDNKQGRSRPAKLMPSSRGLLEAVGVERLQNPPQRLREAASPWDQDSTTEQQLKTEKALGAVSGWVWRARLPEEIRAVIDLRNLRHHAARRLLGATVNGRPAFDLLQVAGLLSTSTQQIEDRYSDHWRFAASEIAEIAEGLD